MFAVETALILFTMGEETDILRRQMLRGMVMTTIQKTITIPANHRIELDLPDSLPVGEAEIVVTISPKISKTPRRSLASLAGSLADSPNFSGDAVELVRQWRDEW